MLGVPDLFCHFIFADFEVQGSRLRIRRRVHFAGIRSRTHEEMIGVWKMCSIWEIQTPGNRKEKAAAASIRHVTR